MEPFGRHESAWQGFGIATMHREDVIKAKSMEKWEELSPEDREVMVGNAVRLMLLHAGAGTPLSTTEIKTEAIKGTSQRWKEEAVLAHAIYVLRTVYGMDLVPFVKPVTESLKSDPKYNLATNRINTRTYFVVSEPWLNAPLRREPGLRSFLNAEMTEIEVELRGLGTACLAFILLSRDQQLRESDLTEAMSELDPRLLEGGKGADAVGMGSWRDSLRTLVTSRILFKESRNEVANDPSTPKVEFYHVGPRATAEIGARAITQFIADVMKRDVSERMVTKLLRKETEPVVQDGNLIPKHLELGIDPDLRKGARIGAVFIGDHEDEELEDAKVDWSKIKGREREQVEEDDEEEEEEDDRPQRGRRALKAGDKRRAPRKYEEEEEEEEEEPKRRRKARK